jgi:hypothetical protein
MTLESIVPSLEDCKRIPEGSFTDSAFMRGVVNGVDTIIHRDNLHVFNVNGEMFYPAPTLEEILNELPESVRIKASNNCIKYDDVDEVFHAKNPATAALRLWFRLKGVQG